MSGAAQGPDRLLDEAIDLIIRLQNDPGNLVSIEMVRGWRARSAVHEQVWARVSAAHGMSGKILVDHRKIERRKMQGLTRRKLVIGGAVGLGTAAAGAYFIPDAIIQARADHITVKGQIQRVALPDGSTATLGPDSALALDYGADRRGVELLKGMSFFDVTGDARRPFQVSTGGFRVRAVGTGFDISNDAGMVSVSVDHGLVEARVATAAGAQLKAGEWMTVDLGSRSVDRGTRDASQIAAWRDNLIIAEREPISALVARISRWHPGRVLVADPFIGAQRVSGLFDLVDPKRALEAVVHPAGGHVRQITSNLTLISPL